MLVLFREYHKRYFMLRLREHLKAFSFGGTDSNPKQQYFSIFSAFSLESNALKGPLWLAGPLAGPLAGWPAGCLKNSAGEARRDFGFFALNS